MCYFKACCKSNPKVEDHSLNLVQMYKVFFNEQSLSIYSEQDILTSADYIVIDSDEQIKPIIIQFIEGDEDLNLVSKDPQLLFEHIKQSFKYVEAAGGLVTNADEEYLMIYRLGYWDLPKGKCHSNETGSSCAMREIVEECGLKSLKMHHHIIDTYHIYEHKEQMYLKKTSWYLFESLDPNEELIPQTEEDIEQVVWFDQDELEFALDETYPNITMVFEAHKNKL